MVQTFLSEIVFILSLFHNNFGDVCRFTFLFADMKWKEKYMKLSWEKSGEKFIYWDFMTHSIVVVVVSLEQPSTMQWPVKSYCAHITIVWRVCIAF